MTRSDYEKFKNSVIDGCLENIFDENYVDYFLLKNDLNYVDADAITYFKNKNYSNSRIFKILFAKSLNMNYSSILNEDLLQSMVDIAISNDKIAVSTLMAYTCFEKIDSQLNIEIFKNRFSILSYLVENQICNNQNKINLPVSNYLVLK